MNRIAYIGLGLAIGLTLGAAGMAVAQNAAVATLPEPTAPMTNETLGSIDLGKAFPQMKGYRMAMSYRTVAPGAGRAMHSHAQGPEIVHALTGVLSEQRQGQAPTTFGPGSTRINDEATVHAVINMGNQTATFYSVSVLKVPTAPQ